MRICSWGAFFSPPRKNLASFFVRFHSCWKYMTKSKSKKSCCNQTGACPCLTRQVSSSLSGSVISTSFPAGWYSNEANKWVSVFLSIRWTRTCSKENIHQMGEYLLVITWTITLCQWSLRRFTRWNEINCTFGSTFRSNIGLFMKIKAE